jgi:hypothetical protein
MSSKHGENLTVAALYHDKNPTKNSWPWINTQGDIDLTNSHN